MSLDIIPDPKRLEERNDVYRLNWVSNFRLDNPKDWGLALQTDTEIPPYILEIYCRFFKLDYIWKYGSRCVFMSRLLRRIFRLHGYEAHTRQVVFTYEHPDRPAWGCQVGTPQQYIEGNELDVHQVCVVDKFLLDWAVLPVTFGRCGIQAPLAFISKSADTINYFDPLQDFGDYGKANWLPRRPKNDMVKHWAYETQQEEHDVTKEYFRIYKMERHDAKRDLSVDI